MDEESSRFWIIPIVALAMGLIVLGSTVEYKINTLLPIAAIELDEIKSMSCDQIKKRNGVGSYAIPENGVIARDKVKTCIDAEKAYKKNLSDIRTGGTHAEKLEAGFTQLWFGVYDHPDLSFTQKTGIIKIIHTKEHGISKFVPQDTMAIIGYNNTIKFSNQSDMPFLIQENHDLFVTKLIVFDDADTITLDNPGQYEYFGKPWMTGTITVVDINGN